MILNLCNFRQSLSEEAADKCYIYPCGDESEGRVENKSRRTFFSYSWTKGSVCLPALMISVSSLFKSNAAGHDGSQ
jgi:hypothetical protein